MKNNAHVRKAMAVANPVMLEDIERIHRTIGVEANRRFAGATVVITGCAGFLGFYLTQYLVRYSKTLGIKKIIGLDTFLLDRPAWLSELLDLAPGIFELHTFDISRSALADVANASEARFVIHAASIASPTFYRKFPLETIDANIWGLRSVLDFYRDSKTLQGILFFSSSEIYGDPDRNSIPTDENYRGNVACVGPRACYDESKRFGETLCYVFAKKHAMPITVARPFNNYGPGMRLTDLRLPGDFAKCVVEGRDLVMLSDGKPTRTFCYVSDAVAGYLLCLLHGKFDSFNIGTESPEIMVRELAEIYRAAGAEIFGYAGAVQYQTSDDPEYMTDNPNRRCPSIAKARAMLRYNPVVAIDDGVRRYLKFLKFENGAAA